MFIIYAGLLIIGAPLFLVDLFFVVVGVTGVTRALWLVARGVDATGRVTLVDPRAPGMSTKVTVAYETPGGKFHVDGRTKRQLHLGDQMAVRYHPDKPAFATTLLSPWKRTFIGIPTVLLILAMSGGMVTSAMWYFRGTHTSLQLFLGEGSFLGLIALASVYGAAIQYAALWRWRSRVKVDGKAVRFDEKRGILVSFESADGPEQFWEPAGSVDIGSSDDVTVYYDPDWPATSATLRNAYGVQTMAIWWTVFALIAGPLAIFALTQL